MSENLRKDLLRNLKDFIAPNCLQDVRVIIEDEFREFKLKEDAYYEDLLSRVKLIDSMDLGLPTLRGDDISDDINEESPKHKGIYKWGREYRQTYESCRTLNREMDEYYETPCVDVTCQCHEQSTEFPSQL